jgi:hypothetical protein
LEMMHTRASTSMLCLFATGKRAQCGRFIACY